MQYALPYAGICNLKTIALSIPFPWVTFDVAGLEKANAMFSWVYCSLAQPHARHNPRIALEALTLQFVGYIPSVTVLFLFSWWCLDASLLPPLIPNLSSITIEFRDYDSGIRFCEIQDAISILLPRLHSMGLLRLVDGGPASSDFM